MSPRSRFTPRRKQTLAKQFPPSAACACQVCLSYCQRPGWWTVAEAERAIAAGYAGRMMLEMAPGNAFGVLSPAFKGCEADFARQQHAQRGCNFLNSENRCDLYGTGCQPLECRFCHHSRPGQGPLCHAALEQDWNTPAGRALVVRWTKPTGLWQRLNLPPSAPPEG